MTAASRGRSRRSCSSFPRTVGLPCLSLFCGRYPAGFESTSSWWAWPARVRGMGHWLSSGHQALELHSIIPHVFPHCVFSRPPAFHWEIESPFQAVCTTIERGEGVVVKLWASFRVMGFILSPFMYALCDPGHIDHLSGPQFPWV